MQQDLPWIKLMIIVFLKLDYSNAFNSIRRDVIAENLFKVTPELLHWYEACYSQASYLSFGNEIIISDTGTQQGAPDGVLHFCIGYHDVLKGMKSRLKIGYVDDISAIDDWRVGLKDLVTLISESVKMGIFLNGSK